MNGIRIDCSNGDRRISFPVHAGQLPWVESLLGL